MARKAIINGAKTYYDNRFRCEFLTWKPEDTRTRVAWCKRCNNKCSYGNYPKVNDNHKTIQK